MDINNIIKKLDMQYYDNLIEYCKLNNLSYKTFQNKKDEFDKIEVTDTESSPRSSSKNPVENESKIVYSEDYLYKKDWNKLQNVHKIVKLKEFISKLLIKNNDEKENLINEATNLIHKKILTKKDKVKYDSASGNIISISLLSFKNGKYKINI
tara:strand:+ start:1102 stop:1560 length:459 start_codon:yes stop_codon:yes gene_type:complete